MRTTLLAGMAVLLFLSCNQGPVRYTQNAPEIDTIKQLLANYDSQSYDTSMYADSSKTYYNTKDNPLSPGEVMDYHKQNDASYSARGFEEDNQEYEKVLADNGETWVNCWVNWKGTIAATGKEIAIPAHLTYQFVEGKIVKEYGYWDPTEVVLELQKIEAQAKKANGDEETASE